MATPRNRRAARWLRPLGALTRVVWNDRILVLLVIVSLVLFAGSWMYALATRPAEGAAGVGVGGGQVVMAAPGARNWVGTDTAGRDMLQRILYGAHLTLSAGLLSTAIAIGAGVLVVYAFVFLVGARGYEWLNGVSRAAACFPAVGLAATAVAIFQPGFWRLVLIVGGIGAFMTVGAVSRLMARIESSGFLVAARASGLTRQQLIVNHILPNSVPQIAVIATILLPGAVLLESALNFAGLGFGEHLTPLTWGGMIAEGRAVIFEAPWIALYPGVAMLATALLFASASTLLKKDLHLESPEPLV